MSHNAGPWEVFTLASSAGTSYRINSRGLSGVAIDIAHIPMQWSGDGSNARLIAAAPDMLNALNAALAVVRMAATEELRANLAPTGVKRMAAKERLALVEAAIAKATGAP